MNEITAYNTGVARALQGDPVIRFLQMPGAFLVLLLTPEEWAAREHLGHDIWAHWVREGYEAGCRETGR